MKTVSLSFNTRYGLWCAVLFALQTTFTASKYCEFTTTDVVATPWYCLSNLMLCVLYLGFIVMYRQDAVLWCGNAPGCGNVYWLGVILYWLGYGVFGVGSLFTWMNRDYDADYDPDDVKFMTFIGSSLFLVGSFLLLIASTPPWPSSDYKPSCDEGWEEFVFGPPRIWYGSMCFLIGSVFFVMASILDYWDSPFESAETETRFWQTGVLLFVPGRLWFLADAIHSVRAGQEFRYGGSAVYVDKVESAVIVALRLFKTLREATKRVDRRHLNKSQAMARITKQATPLGLPGGSWKRRAKRQPDGSYGAVERVKNGSKCQLRAQLEIVQNGTKTGQYKDAQVTFEEWDTFTATDDGEFVLGCTAGLKMSSTRNILDLCDLYDELDYSANSILTYEDLWKMTEAVGQGIDKLAIQKIVDDLDQDGGNLRRWNHETESFKTEQGKKGLDFPEFMMLTSAEVDPVKHRVNVEKTWRVLDPDQTGFATKASFEALLARLDIMSSTAGHCIESGTSELGEIVDEYFKMWDLDADSETMSKAEFYAVIAGALKPNDEVTYVSITGMQREMADSKKPGKASENGVEMLMYNNLITDTVPSLQQEVENYKASETAHQRAREQLVDDLAHANQMCNIKDKEIARLMQQLSLLKHQQAQEDEEEEEQV